MKNEKVVSERIKEKRQVRETITKRRNNVIGHTLRHDGLLKLIIEGQLWMVRPEGEDQERNIIHGLRRTRT